MELPFYNDMQPGCTYFYSPRLYNLGVVNHVHTEEDGDVQAYVLLCLPQGGRKEGHKKCCIVGNKNIMTAEPHRRI